MTGPRRPIGPLPALLLIVAGLAGIGPASAAAYRPPSDDVVLERLPPRGPARVRALAPAAAAATARAHIERARRAGDPREWGYAQGALAPWWHAADAPDEVMLMRATLRQSQHDFDGALADLERLLARRPDHAQAWLTRATVLRVQGRLDAAAAACGSLRGRATDFVATLCLQAVRGLSGQLPSARAALAALLPQVPAQPPDVAAWFHAERADMAVRAGAADEAEAIYVAALERHPTDIDLRAAHADLLLDRGRAAEVLRGIAPDTPIEALRLRRALALHALGEIEPFAALDARIRDAFAAARRRGDALHLREEARYRLATGGDPALALRDARANWALQHEPWDVRVLLDAASAAAEPEAARPVREWIAATGYQDARLAPAGRPQ